MITYKQLSIWQLTKFLDALVEESAVGKTD